ncbi:hypothetical protein NLG97_g10013 [Lecanicillium saksenae]|uniref:Uncharacterized protein n=1 Tax=Lecanicillium saksenae TaxID=468837 RepID=A0ACC1QGE7_9HYPO|nr:hypothetical protein NLG97_g10013 [Lecanicillium saksenae]
MGADPPLLTEPMSLTRLISYVEDARPCSTDDVDLVDESPVREGCVPRSEADSQYRQAKQLQRFVRRYCTEAHDDSTATTVLEHTTWDMVSEESLQYRFYLQADDMYKPDTDFLYNERIDEDPNIWSIEDLFMHYTDWENRETLEESKPHAICHILDSTPLVGGRVRTVELKAAIFTALMCNNIRFYNHLDCFAITVMSYWNRSVRIVQGLVHFKQMKVDLRVSDTQSFPDGFRHDADSYQRFLRVLAFHCGSVGPLPR